MVRNVVVTAVAENGFYVQVPNDAPDYAGPTTVESLSMEAITSYHQRSATPLISKPKWLTTQVKQLSYPDVSGASGTYIVPAPIAVKTSEIATGGSKSDAFEGVLVVVSDITVTELEPDTIENGPNNEFAVSDGSGALIVDDALHLTSPYPAVGDDYQSITGVVYYGWSNHKLAPRTSADIAVGPPTIKAFNIATVYAVENATGTFTTPQLTLQLTSPAVEALNVSLTSDNPNVAVPSVATLTFQPDEQSNHVRNRHLL